jgi:L,D-transpeptidase ErfK/SrfK
MLVPPTSLKQRLDFCLTMLMILFCFDAAATTYPLSPLTDMAGSITLTISREQDTLLDIGRRNSLGYAEIRLANPGVDPLLPGAGQQIKLPSLYIIPAVKRRGIVLNLAERRLYYFPDHLDGTQRELITFPVGIGRDDWPTPQGISRIIQKQKDPRWIPTASIRQEYADRGELLPSIVPPGGNNPLGRYALRLSWPSYLLHGTNKPDGVGMKISHGCIRLFPEHINQLFRRVAVDTDIRIIDESYKVGWSGGSLYLEVHPPGYVSNGGHHPNQLVRAIIRATKAKRALIDWERVEQIRKSANGIPQVIGHAAAASSGVTINPD